MILAGLACAGAAHAVDGVAVEIGFGNENTELARVGLQWKWDRRWSAGRAWTLGGYWDLQLGRWSGPLRPRQEAQSVWDLGITPVFRLERTERTRVWPYVEAAIGFHLLSMTHYRGRVPIATCATLAEAEAMLAKRSEPRAGGGM